MMTSGVDIWTLNWGIMSFYEFQPPSHLIQAIGKLTLRYIGLYSITERVGKVAY